MYIIITIITIIIIIIVIIVHLLHVQEVFNTPGFNEMSEDALSFILKSDKLTMDEEEILLKVKEWARVNSVRTSTYTIYMYMYMYVL